MPQPNRNRIGERSEFIEKNDLCFDATKLPAELVRFRNFNAGNCGGRCLIQLARAEVTSRHARDSDGFNAGWEKGQIPIVVERHGEFGRGRLSDEWNRCESRAGTVRPFDGYLDGVVGYCSYG